MFSYIWEYRVSEAHREAFEEAYGADGEWVRLFRRAPGYIGTSLLSDRDDPGRYLTIDRWSTAAAHRSFRADFAAEFEALDEACETLTESETPLGDFDPISESQTTER